DPAMRPESRSSSTRRPVRSTATRRSRNNGSQSEKSGSRPRQRTRATGRTIRKTQTVRPERAPTARRGQESRRMSEILSLRDSHPFVHVSPFFTRRGHTTCTTWWCDSNKGELMRRWLIACSVALLAAGFAATAYADEWNKLTYLTFSGPVNMPGITLPAGTYRFELADPDSSRRVVRVSEKDGTKSYGM